MSNFNGMNARQIAEAILHTPEPDQVTPKFLELENLDPRVSALVIELLENTAIGEITRGSNTVDMWRLKTEFTGQPLDLSHFVNEAVLKRMHVATQVYMNVALLKGEAAHPLMKAYAQEVSRLSADEYYSPALLLAAFKAVQSLSQGPVFPEDIVPPKYSEIRKRKPKKGPGRFTL